MIKHFFIACVAAVGAAVHMDLEQQSSSADIMQLSQENTGMQCKNWKRKEECVKQEGCVFWQKAGKCITKEEQQKQADLEIKKCGENKTEMACKMKMNRCTWDNTAKVCNPNLDR